MTTQEKEEKREVSDIEKKVYEMISDGVMMVDRHGIIRYMNKAGFEILGVSQDAIGKPLTEITRFKPELYDVLTTGIGWVDKEFILDMKNKKSLHLVKSAIPLFDENNNIIGVLDTFREINNVRNTINKMTGARSKFTFEDIKYRSSLMQKQVELAKKIAASDSVVLIQGESGTGKELFAHAIHGYSSRKDGPFITLDCATIPHDLVESELFGYVEGAFTGARRGGRPGKFEMAHNGTIFLDEVSEMTPLVQKKFLRVLQSFSVIRIGDSRPIPVDIRVIAATNKNLEKEVKEKSFREDLYYRLNVINIQIPPLRDRTEDIMPLAEHFIGDISRKLGKKNIVLSEQAKRLMLNYTWPGNVRELKNTIERALNIMENHVITPDLLPPKIQNYHAQKEDQDNRSVHPVKTAIKSLNDIEKNEIVMALNRFNGNKTLAAASLGIARSTLYEKIKKYNINRNDPYWSAGKS